MQKEMGERTVMQELGKGCGFGGSGSDAERDVGLGELGAIQYGM